MKKLLLSIVILISSFLFGNTATYAAAPEGFLTTEIVAGLNTPTDFTFIPDGRIFILEKDGHVKVYKNGALLSQPFTHINVNQQSERGLLGSAIDPDFAINKYIYFFYTGSDLINRIVRYDASDDVSTQPPTIIYEVTLPAGTIHLGGTLAFGPDGKLYASIGNNGVQAYSQNLTNAYGKILRLNKDGSIPSDNPFVGDPSKKSEIWAYGLRNPFRFHFDTISGKLYAGDVGDSAWEEINIVTKGKDYGYPNTEGSCQNCSSENPIYQYFHTGNQSFSITGGPVYRGSTFPSEYYGSLFFADYAQGFIHRITFDSNGNQNQMFIFDSNAGSVVDMEQGLDGNLYYLTIYPGALKKVSFANSNLPPVANLSSNVTSGSAPLVVQFSSAGSIDPENQPLTFNWNFGDGNSSNLANPSHTFSSNGTYTTTLQVSDGVNTSSDSATITVGQIPTITISKPLSNLTYNAGDTIEYQATATNSQENNLPQSSFLTEIIFRHNTHTHPFDTRNQNSSGTFIVPNIDNHSDVNTWYEIKFTVTDSEGLSNSKSVFVYPNVVNLTFLSEPNNAVLYLDSIPFTSPSSIEGLVGFIRELKPQLIQNIGGQMYHFHHWSNNGPAIQQITTPSSNQTYTAFFTPLVSFNAEYFANKTLSGNPTLTRTDQIIDFVWNEDSPHPSLPQDQFSARWQKNQYFPSGNYKFTAAVDDGVRVYVDNQLIIDKWQNQPVTEYSTVIQLDEGNHDIKMEYYEEYGGAIAKLNWTLTTETPRFITGYKAEYYSNKSLSGPVTLTVYEKNIDHVWNRHAPYLSIPADQFSTRWTKNITTTEGVYKFNVHADDGVRLYIDNVKVLDKWFDQPVTQYSIEKYLSDGSHVIVMEYYENYGGAIAKMSYSKINTTSGYNAEYFDNMTLSGSPRVTRNDVDINFVWNNTSPHPDIPNDRFSARWTKQKDFAAGNYNFLLKSDDGIRFWIDNQLIIDDWTDHPMRTYTPTVNLTAGMHVLKIEYYENGGGAVAIFKEN